MSQISVTKTRCMLKDANLGKKFWGEVMMTANYQLNREPDKVSNRTPFEMWYNAKPKFADLRVFGSVAKVQVACDGWQRYDRAVVKAIFVGYASEQKGY